jgi:hypothetical protein
MQNLKQMDGLWAFLLRLLITSKQVSVQNIFQPTRSSHGKALYNLEVSLGLLQNDASEATMFIAILSNFRVLPLLV